MTFCLRYTYEDCEYRILGLCCFSLGQGICQRLVTVIFLVGISHLRHSLLVLVILSWLRNETRVGVEASFYSYFQPIAASLAVTLSCFVNKPPTAYESLHKNKLKYSLFQWETIKYCNLGD